VKTAAVLLAALLMATVPAWAHHSKVDERLPVIGDAPEFALTDQNGAPFALRDLRGKVVAVTFIYTACTDTCPLLTEKLASLQKPLGADFGAHIRFVAVTVDPERDTPAVLRNYARNRSLDTGGWSLLTGTSSGVQDVVRRYGGFAKKAERGGVDHVFLTSLIDRQGRLRVQYLGYRFKPDEMLADLQALLRE
jgi:protein SCO1/2